jgi:hypothetical protein
MSENEQIVEGEIVPVEPGAVPAAVQYEAVRPARPVPKALTLVGAALAFVGREIVPRVAASLLDAWDRRASSPASTPGVAGGSAPVRSARSSLPDLPGAGGRRHRLRRGRGRG